MQPFPDCFFPLGICAYIFSMSYPGLIAPFFLLLNNIQLSACTTVFLIPVCDLRWKSKDNSVAECGNFTISSAGATKFHLDPAVFEVSLWLLCTEHVMGQDRAGGGGGRHEVPG